MTVTIITGDCREVLATLPERSVQCCVTSPPYFGLRDYGVDGQIGMEPTPDEFVAELVAVFREVRRVLRDDGTLWLNLGDSYGGAKGNTAMSGGKSNPSRGVAMFGSIGQRSVGAAKQLIGIPWRTAFALQADGWWLRQDIIWCLSGGAWVYARTARGDMPMMIRDLARLKVGTVQLWNGCKWTPLLGMSKSKRRGDEIELVLRSGERISCTPTHRFPTIDRGVIDAADLRAGDILQSTRLPEPEFVRDCAIDTDAAWFAGLYLAEGSRSADCIQIAGHAKEVDRWARVRQIAAKFGGSATRTVTGNNCAIRVHGRVLNAIVDELVSGRTAADKCFAPVVWRYSNAFITSMLLGYLSGDGHWDAKNRRWRLGFARNYNLERDLRVAAARLGLRLVLKPTVAQYQGGTRPSFRGELRMERSGHSNERDPFEILEVRKARCREVYDLGVADEPHLFAMASGVLTHNSKPNPMPESVTDRCTKAHEYLFLLTKSERYYFDQLVIAEKAKYPGDNRAKRTDLRKAVDSFCFDDGSRARTGKPTGETINRRSVWTVATQPFKESHFATFPPALIEPCILAGSKPGDMVLDPFGGAGTTGLVADRHGRNATLIELNPAYAAMARARIAADAPLLAEVTA